MPYNSSLLPEVFLELAALSSPASMLASCPRLDPSSSRLAAVPSMQLPSVHFISGLKITDLCAALGSLTHAGATSTRARRASA